MKNRLLIKPALSWYKSTLMLLFTLAVSTAFGQGRNISGTVSDQSTNESLPGATVLVKGTSKGTSTDFDGKFT